MEPQIWSLFIEKDPFLRVNFMILSHSHVSVQICSNATSAFLPAVMNWHELAFGQIPDAHCD